MKITKTNFNDNLRVGIIVPTRNRSEFMTRLLNYYAFLESPHTIYLGDSSDPPETEKIKKIISDLSGKLNVVYHYSPPGDVAKCEYELLTLVKEKYACLLCDDDFHIPSTLTACAEFLEKNPDYASAIGLSVSFKIKGNGVYGEVMDIHDYPRRSIEHETASDRLLEFFGPGLVPLVNCVSRTNQFRYFYEETYHMKDMIFGHDVLPSALLAVAGKYKVIDKLSFIRQLHLSHNPMPDMFDWITGEKWNQHYAYTKGKIIKALIEKDGLDQKEAELSFKKAFWNHLSTWLVKDYNLYLNALRPKQSRKLTIRMRILAKFPFIKSLYRKTLRPLLTKEVQLHYEIIQSNSKYYKDFKAIVDSVKGSG